MIALLEHYRDELSNPLGKAIDFMFLNLEKMDVESNFVLNDFMAFHLSNFDIHWPWSYWGPHVEKKETLDIRQNFLKSLFQKLSRVSYRFFYFLINYFLIIFNFIFNSLFYLKFYLKFYFYCIYYFRI